MNIAIISDNSAANDSANKSTGYLCSEDLGVECSCFRMLIDFLSFNQAPFIQRHI